MRIKMNKIEKKNKRKLLIKRYKKQRECYTDQYCKTLKQLIIQKRSNKTKYKVTRRLKKLGTILKEILKILIIFNLINIIQLILVENPEINILMDGVELIKKYGFELFLKILMVKKIFNITLLLSGVMLFVIYLIIYAITNKKKTSMIITATITYLFSIVNYIITEIRGSALTLYDIQSIETALNVSDNITIPIDSNIKKATLIFFITIILILFLYKNCKKMNKKKRITSAIISVISVIIIVNTSTVQEINVWNMQKAYTKNGVVLTLVRLAKDIKLKEPEDYRKEDVENILASYKNDESLNYNNDTNIIVIMNESFTDYKEIPGIKIKKDNIPYFHSLQKEDNTIKGIMHSDGFGAYTANMEYEFLTQNTVAFMSRGSIPYQQYIREPIESIVTKLSKLNYTTYGNHLWKKGGYNRETVYRLLGFDYYKFKEDYDDLQYTVNSYTTDECAYSKIIEVFENKTEKEKVFSFNVTMQNHSQYKKEDKEQIKYSDNRIFNVYLQMQHYSDIALKNLIEYLKNYDEKVILLFFGDHQPKVHISKLEDDEENKWKVPYLIWANYDIEEKDYGQTSANYLQSILLEVANLPKDEYTNYITELRKEIPVLTANYYIGDNRKKYNFEDKSSPYYNKIKEYEKIVYYHLLDGLGK